MASQQDHDQEGFAVVRHGFDRNQVKQHVQRLEEDALRAAAERDEARARTAELSGQLELARREITALTERLDALAASPEDPDRARHIARTQATEITTRARTAAEDVWASAERASAELRDRYRTMLTDLDRRHREIHREHETIMETAKSTVTEMTVTADQRRQALDERAEAERVRIQQEFDAEIADRRERVTREIDAERARAQEEARRVVREACDEADRRIATATSQVERLTALREQLAGRLRGTGELLAESAKLLEPLEAEAELAPDTVAELSDDDSTRPIR